MYHLCKRYRIGLYIDYKKGLKAGYRNKNPIIKKANTNKQSKLFSVSS